MQITMECLAFPDTGDYIFRTVARDIGGWSGFKGTPSASSKLFHDAFTKRDADFKTGGAGEMGIQAFASSSFPTALPEAGLALDEEDEKRCQEPDEKRCQEPILRLQN
jgi:hypothetical protein